MKLTQTQIGNAKPNPIFKGLPKRLKDPKAYEEVEKQVLDIIRTDHKHQKVITWSKCKDCQTRFNEKRALLKKIGFKSLSQYLEWKKVMDIMINKKDIQL